MDYKKILKLSLATFVVTVFLFLLSFKVVMFIVKKEINTLLDSNDFEKKIYSLTIDNIAKFSEKKPLQSDKEILKRSIQKIYNNYKDILPN
tara:strand:- start:1133 stop:1405 length:273 start_codon:yes stop_codon:yes gene_type:complete